MNLKIPNENSPKEIANSIYDLLCDPKVGSAKNKNNNNREDFVDRIIPTIKEKSRLLFVLPGFPFKDQNRFRVPFNANIPDFSEISFMIRLYNLTQTIYQVHPYGVDIIILTDGELYRNIFGISEEMVSQYLNRLVTYRNALNLQGTFSFISLKELIDRSSNNSTAWSLADHIKKVIMNLFEASNSEINKHIDILISGMKWNLENRDSLSHISDDVCWKILRWKDNEIEEDYREIWHKVHSRAVNAALNYASINLMIRWTNLISTFFPDSIRCTIHPKLGQFALSGSGNAYAWNGIAYSKKWPTNIDDIRTTTLLNLCESPIMNQAIFEDSGLPCFYTESTLNSNIEAAKMVLSATGWTFEEIFGREFTIEDQQDFISLGLNDEHYTWERKIQNDRYFNGLFQFRISHYKKYGFGIHGIWLGENLIGQFGLQVINEELDEIELVIFLGKAYVKRGLGSKLIKFIINRCAELGISDLYGIVRPDNIPAINLLKNVNGKQIKTVKHFNQEGILYQINVKGVK